MDITPVTPAGRQLVESYGGGRFRVSGQIYNGSVLVFPEQTLDWPVAAFSDITLDSLMPVLNLGGLTVDVLLLGCGASMALVPADLRSGAKGAEDSISVLKAWRGGVLAERPMFFNDHKEAQDHAAGALRLDDPRVDGRAYPGKWKLFFDAVDAPALQVAQNRARGEQYRERSTQCQ